MELFYPLLPKGSKAELRKSVRKLTRTLGGMRNVDEALIFFHSQAGTDRSADATLCHALSVRRTRELKRIVKMLKTFDHRALGRKVRKMAAGLNAETITLRNNISVPAYLSEAYLNQYLPVHPLLAGALSPEHRATRHALRIIIKKWRYFLEIVTPILERDYAPLLEQLKEYQSILGRMNDLAEFGLLLNKLKLPPTERTQAEATLLTEDARLLKSFRELSELKPLAASFQI